MAARDAAAIAALIAAIAERMTAEKAHLCEIDGAIGDADHGIAMELGFNAARDAVAALDMAQATPGEVFIAAGKAFLSAVGASTGPLYATAMMQAGASVKGAAALDDAQALGLFEAFEAGMIRRGKAKPGDKTMLDAWSPAASEARAAREAGRSFAEAAPGVAAAAKAGAEATKDMVASMGRAARLGDRSLGHPDPGAVSGAMIVATMCETL